MDIRWEMIARIIKMMQRKLFLLKRANIEKSCFFLRLWLFFFFFSLQSFLNYFFLASRLLNCGGWSSGAWCCVLSSRVRFSGQWRVTQIVLWRERSRCAAGKSLGWQRLQLGVLFFSFFFPFNHRREPVFLGDTEEQVSRKNQFIGLPSVAVCLVYLK